MCSAFMCGTRTFMRTFPAETWMADMKQIHQWRWRLTRWWCCWIIIVINRYIENDSTHIRVYVCAIRLYAVRLHAPQLDSIRFVSSNSDFFHLNNLQETNNINNNFMKCSDLIRMKLDEFVVICFAFFCCFSSTSFVVFLFYLRQWLPVSAIEMKRDNLWDGHLFFTIAAIFILSLLSICRRRPHHFHLTFASIYISSSHMICHSTRFDSILYTI